MVYCGPWGPFFYCNHNVEPRIEIRHKETPIFVHFLFRLEIVVNVPLNGRLVYYASNPNRFQVTSKL